jgi:hypothetical protein
MHVGNLQSGSGRIQEALEQLQLAWAGAAEVWKDANARSFDEQHLRTIVDEINVAIPAISHLAQVLQAARRELEE